MEQRPPKHDDQIRIDMGYSLIQNLMQRHPQIEPSLWASACWSTIANGYAESGCTYEEFCEELDRIKIHYKSWFHG